MVIVLIYSRLTQSPFFIQFSPITSDFATTIPWQTISRAVLMKMKSDVYGDFARGLSRAS